MITTRPLPRSYKYHSRKPTQPYEKCIIKMYNGHISVYYRAYIESIDGGVSGLNVVAFDIGERFQEITLDTLYLYPSDKEEKIVSLMPRAIRCVDDENFIQEDNMKEVNFNLIKQVEMQDGLMCWSTRISNDNRDLLELDQSDDARFSTSRKGRI